MKKQIALIASALLLAGSHSYPQSGQNCFNTRFNESATSLNEVNAYLMGYLCTMSYADYLRYLINQPPPAIKGATVTKLRNDYSEFITVFSNKLSYLFRPSGSAAPNTLALAADARIAFAKADVTSPNLTAMPSEPAVTFRFFNECDPGGYDPEAILISTPSTLYVIFRGTDRVACNVDKTGYEWNEWLKTDFKFLKRDASVMHNSIRGQVHRGMVESLMYKGFAEDLASAVVALRKNKQDGSSKKVWIGGHSLGGAHAQLFAMYLKFNKSITAQGVYVYESPHPGDAAFVDHLNDSIGKRHIQRFEFGDDPICTLPPLVFFYDRAGERNFFKDYSSPVLRTEQTPLDDAKILCALGNLPGEQIPAFARLQFPPYCPGSACFHHPTLILEAVRHDLSTSLLASLPPAVPLPLPGDNCNQGDLTKAENNDVVNNTVTAIENTIAQIAWTAGNIIDNLLGSGVPEGDYKIACYAFKNNAKRYLEWNGNVGSQVKISRGGTVFNLTHKATGGYQIWKSGANLAADVKYSFGAPTGEERSNNILMKDKDGIIGDEETWYFFKVPNTSNTYVLYNWNTHRVLDAPDNCLSDSGDCPVNEFHARSSNPTQVWILERQ